MKKSNIISQIAFAWGLGVISVAPVWAQTCIKTPSCADLGYTKTTTACAGKTILKCPLDTTKVYCPSYEETLRTYKVGDTYIGKDGVGVGTVVQVDSTGKHGVVVSSSAVAGTQAEVSQACAGKTTAGLSWGVADANLLSKALRENNTGSCYWVANGFCAVGAKYINWCNSNAASSFNPCTAVTSRSSLGAYCQASF